jgi:putative FmdB family regulatory protein
MPIYEYACDKCSSEFEVEQRITDDPVKSCPMCRSRKVRRLISQTSFVLKGGGWYSDLYSSPGGKDGPDKGPGGAKADGGSDSKSDSGSDAKASPKSDSGSAGGSDSSGSGKKGKGAKAAA